MVLQLVTPRELLATGGAPVRGFGDPIKGAGELAPALACVHHLLDLEETVGDLQEWAGQVGWVRGEEWGVRSWCCLDRLGMWWYGIFQSVCEYTGYALLFSFTSTFLGLQTLQ